MSSTGFMKGMGVGLVVGSAIGVAMVPHKKSMARGKAGKTLKAVGEVIENVTEALGF